MNWPHREQISSSTTCTALACSWELDNLLEVGREQCSKRFTIFISSQVNGDSRFKKTKKLCRGSCTQPDPKYFSFLFYKRNALTGIKFWKNKKAKKGIKFRTVHTHGVRCRKNLRFAKSGWGCKHVCAYIYRFSLLCVWLTCCIPSNHPIMVNVQQEIFKYSKLI